MTKTNTFAQRLQFVMDEKNVTRSQVAKAIGINKGNLTRYLNGDYEPKHDVLHRLAELFRVTDEWLMGYDAPMMADDPRVTAQKEDLVNGDPELTELLTRARDDPNIRMLFSVTKGATAKDIEQAIKIIQALKWE